MLSQRGVACPVEEGAGGILGVGFGICALGMVRRVTGQLRKLYCSWV